MRHVPPVIKTALAVASAGILVGACGSGSGSEGHEGHENSAATTTSATPTRAAIAVAALDGLLLTPAEIDAAMGVTGMSPKEKIEKLPDDSTKKWPQDWKWPAECMYAYGPAEAPVYVGSGNTAVRGRDDTAPTATPGIGDMDPEFTQAVVLFPSAAEANAFYTASAKAWPACSDRQFTIPSDPENPEVKWKIGALSTANSTLSTPVSVSMTQGANSIGGTCQRVLTVRNNVAIDVSGCAGKDPGDIGIKLANLIAGKVEKQ